MSRHVAIFQLIFSCFSLVKHLLNLPLVYSLQGILCSEHLVMFWVVVLPSGAHEIIWSNLIHLILGLVNAGATCLRLIAGRRLYVVGMYFGVQDQVGQQCVTLRDAAMDLEVLILQVLALMYHFTGLPGHCLSGACERSWCRTGVEGRMKGFLTWVYRLTIGRTWHLLCGVKLSAFFHQLN